MLSKSPLCYTVKTILLFLATMVISSLHGQILLEPISSPELVLSYINTEGKEVFFQCGDALPSGAFQEVLMADGRHRYDIRLRNVGEIAAVLRPEDVRLGEDIRGFEQILSGDSRSRSLPILLDYREATIISFVNAPYCPGGYVNVTLDFAGISGFPCKFRIYAQSPPLVEGTMISIADGGRATDADPFNGIVEFRQIDQGSTSTRFPNLRVSNLGNTPAVITGVSSTGILEIVTFEVLSQGTDLPLPVTIGAGETVQLKCRIPSFNCGEEVGEIHLETTASLGGCGLPEDATAFPYRIKSIVSCPGSDYEVYINEEITTPGWNSLLYFEEDEVKTMRVENTGSTELILDGRPLFFDEIAAGFSSVNGCHPQSIFTCPINLLPGESYSCELLPKASCNENCFARMGMPISGGFPLIIRFALTDRPTNVSNGDIKGKAEKGRVRNFSHPLEAGFKTNDSPQNFRVFPTLAFQTITIELDTENQMTKTIELINQMGQSMKKISLSPGSQRTKLSVSDLSSGLYFVRIKGTKTIQRFVKK